jgi:quercetin dioxygenase-like cupin family protein
MATALLSLGQPASDRRLARSIWYHGTLMTTHVDSADTNGAFALLEMSGQTGGEPPLHVHDREDELFYVLEGELKVFRGCEELILREGDAGFLPRRVPHTFKITSSFARFLIQVTPGGFENYFRELGEPAGGLQHKGLRGPLDFNKVGQVAARYGVTMIQPV